MDVELLHEFDVKFNARMMGAIDAMAKACHVSIDVMRRRLLVLTGRFDVLELGFHRAVYIPHSMSRNDMDHDERVQFWADLKEVATERILPGVEQAAADKIIEWFKEPWEQGR